MEIDPNVAGDPTRSTVKSLCHEWTSTKGHTSRVHASSDNTAALAILSQTLHHECVGGCRSEILCLPWQSACWGKEQRETAKPNLEIWEVWKHEASRWGAHLWSGIWNAPDYITSKWSAGMNVIVAHYKLWSVTWLKKITFSHIRNSSWTLSEDFVSNTAMRNKCNLSGK